MGEINTEGWVWKCQVAKREEKKGRAKDGIITGIKCEMRYEENKGERFKE